MLEKDIDELVFEPPELGCVLSLTGLPGGGSKIFDRSPYGTHGNITGASWKFQNGLWGLQTDADDDKITLVHIPLITFTILSWFKRMGTAGGTSTSYHNIILHLNGVASGSENRLLVNDDDGRALAQVFCDSTSYSAYSGIPSDKNAFNQYGIIFDGNNVYGILNGIIGDGTATLGNLASGTTALTWGDCTTVSYKPNGIFALLKICPNTVLNADQVKDIFDKEKHLFGVW